MQNDFVSNTEFVYISLSNLVVNQILVIVQQIQTNFEITAQYAGLGGMLLSVCEKIDY